PNATGTYEGPAAGPGATMHWAGNMKVGEGSMKILESQPNKLIRIQLDFLKPMRGTDTAEWTFTPEGSGTRVSWTMFGKNNFVSKAMSLVMNCDKMIGGQFEKGLSQLQSVVEKR